MELTKIILFFVLFCDSNFSAKLILSTEDVFFINQNFSATFSDANFFHIYLSPVENYEATTFNTTSQNSLISF